jgi:MFS family permease
MATGSPTRACAVHGFRRSAATSGDHAAVLAALRGACEERQPVGSTGSPGFPSISMSVTVDRRAASAADVVALVATLASVYVVSQFLRNSVGVIAPDIAAEMRIPAKQIGLLSSAFFFAFATMQLPLGVAIDRFGPKRCMLACAVVVIASALMFAAGRTPGELVAARVIMGFGTTCYLVGPLTLYAQRFSAERFGALAGMHMGIGTLGTLLATAPLAYAAAAVGWRAPFVAIAVVMGLAGLMVALIVREPPRSAAARRETLRESIAGIRAAMRISSVGRLFLMQMATYSSFVIFVGLWGGPYLTHVYGYDLTERGSLLLIPAIAQVLGLTLYGWTDRVFGSHRVPVVIGALTTAGFFAVLALAGTLARPSLIVWLVGFGAFAGFTPVVIAHGKSLFPRELVGRGMTLLNMGSMGGVFVTQTVSGLAIDLFPASNGVYPLDAYRIVFALQAAFLIGAVAIYVPARDPLGETNLQKTRSCRPLGRRSGRKSR